MEEIWKDIEEYKGYYKVSNLGRVKRILSKNCLKEKVRKIQYKKNGYAVVMLSVNHKYKLCHVHRLVAQSFIPNLYNKSQVNHIDLNKTNNCVDNLEWCSPKENMDHVNNLRVRKNNAIKGIGNKRNKPVYQYSLDGVFIKEYYSITNASELCGISGGDITVCCQNKRLSSGGYIWSYYYEKKAVYRRSRTKEVYRVDNNGSFTKYDSIQQAAIDNNVNSPNIIDCCVGRQRTCGGYKWQYLNPNTKNE